jgi:PPOX class probable FMN-dependent enzyme
MTGYRTVTTIDRLREIIVSPQEGALSLLKQHDALDAHDRAFIAKSPFCLLATAGADGRCDVSPKGDAPGFVLVLDERTLVVPDRPGNRRVDSLLNILENPHAGLLFLVPNVEETLRVNGRAAIVEDAELLQRMAVRGRAPQLGILVEVEEVFFHCAKAFKRSGLWQPNSWIGRAELPSFGQILLDQTRPDGCSADDLDARLAESNQRLY